MSSVRLAPIDGRGDAIDIKLHTRVLTNCTSHENMGGTHIRKQSVPEPSLFLLTTKDRRMMKRIGE